MIEQDVIGHLIDVERQAYDLLLDAQTEADRRKATAKEQAEKAYRAAYEQLVGELELALSEGKKQCDASRDREYDDFRNHLRSIRQDRTSFNSYLDSLYSGH